MRNLLSSLVGLALLACGGGAPPPKDTPKVVTVRPTVEKNPPPAAPDH